MWKIIFLLCARNRLQQHIMHQVMGTPQERTVPAMVMCFFQASRRNACHQLRWDTRPACCPQALAPDELATHMLPGIRMVVVSSTAYSDSSKPGGSCSPLKSQRIHLASCLWKATQTSLIKATVTSIIFTTIARCSSDYLPATKLYGFPRWQLTDAVTKYSEPESRQGVQIKT